MRLAEEVRVRDKESDEVMFTHINAILPGELQCEEHVSGACSEQPRLSREDKYSSDEQKQIQHA